MKICYDHLCFWERYGGVSKYFVELIKRLPPENVKLLVKYTNNEYVRQLENVQIKGFLKDFTFRGKAHAESEFGKLFSIPQLVKGNFDIYHPTHYDTYGFKLVPKRVAIVTTIHDMNYFAIPQFYSTSSKIRSDEIKSAQRANHIITISERSKADICNYLNIQPDKITIISHGIDIARIENVKRTKLTDKYILYVGRRGGYKNFANVVKAFAVLSHEYPDLSLICAGLKFTTNEMAYIKDLGVSNKVKSVQASDEQLYNLYYNAIAFVFPSFYEGFGIPILEAMANHCPVVLSDASCFPEIAQNAGLYFNPDEIDDIADKLRKVIEDSELRNNLIRLGDERVKHFSWEKCAEEHMKVYQSLL